MDRRRDPDHTNSCGSGVRLMSWHPVNGAVDPLGIGWYCESSSDETESLYSDYVSTDGYTSTASTHVTDTFSVWEQEYEVLVEITLVILSFLSKPVSPDVILCIHEHLA